MTNNTLATERPQAPILRSEKYYQDRLLLLSNYSPNISFKQEVSVLNTKSEGAKTRRFDIVQQLPDRTRIFEIKKEEISIDTLHEVINSKAYLDLAIDNFGSRGRVELVFTSPKGITRAAKDRLATLPNVFFIPVKDLARIIYEDYYSSLIPEAKWLSKRVKEEFQSLLS